MTTDNNVGPITAEWLDAVTFNAIGDGKRISYLAIVGDKYQFRDAVPDVTRLIEVARASLDVDAQYHALPGAIYTFQTYAEDAIFAEDLDNSLGELHQTLHPARAQEQPAQDQATDKGEDDE